MSDISDLDADDISEIDPWVIPLSGSSPTPTSADAGTPPVLGIVGPGAETPPPAARLDGNVGPTLELPDDEDELPTEGFHPRLRRSA